MVCETMHRESASMESTGYACRIQVLCFPQTSQPTATCTGRQCPLDVDTSRPECANSGPFADEQSRLGSAPR